MSKATAATVANPVGPGLEAKDIRPHQPDRFILHHPASSTPARSSVSKPVVRNSPNYTSARHLSPAFREQPTVRAVTPDPDEDPLPALPSLGHQLHISPSTPPRTPSKGPMNTFPHSTAAVLGSVAKRFDSKSPEAESSPRLRASRTVPSLSSFSDLNLRASSKAAMERSQHSLPADDSSFDYPGGNASYVARSRQAGGTTSSTSSTSTLSSLGSPGSHLDQAQQQTPTQKKRFLRSQHSTNTLTKQNPKASSSTSSLSMQNAHGTINPHFSTTNGAEDVDRVMDLMRQLKGKMEGFLTFRLADSTTWASGHCMIDDERGSLLLRTDGGRFIKQTLIPDLRGCEVRTPTANDEDGTIEVHTRPGGPEGVLKVYKLIPAPNTYDLWLSALLGWSPVRPSPPVRPSMGRRRNSETIPQKDAPSIIKVGKMLLWRRGGKTHNSSGNVVTKAGVKKMPTVAWQRISCTLQDNGEFKLYTEADTQLLTVIQLGHLSRCAVQQLDPSILDQDFCIAIYPQYTPSTVNSSQAKPVYLAVETRMIYEVWFVLLRAFTLPELFPPVIPGKTSDDLSNELEDSYRIQRSLLLRVIEAKIIPQDNERFENLDCYAEVHLDGEVRAKTMVRTKTHNPFWREDYEFPDLPAVLDEVAVVLKQRDPRWKQKGTNGNVYGSGGHGGGLGGASVPGSRDVVIGRVDIKLRKLRYENDAEGWWPLMCTNSRGVEEKVGEMFLKVGLEELLVLCADEYKGLSDVLHDFSNNVTIEISQILAADLSRLSSTLLKLYQVTGKASDWIMSLAEGELDGSESARNQSANQQKPPGTASSMKSNGAFEKFEEFTDVMSTTPPPPIQKPTKPLRDANILFRGNSLLTKSLDAHMRRLGREYLEEVLGSHLQRIAEDDTLCEVDPSKVDRQEDLPKNWKTLLAITRAMWESIYSSHMKCPIELRRILRHIRACVEDRYGDSSTAASYSSVSGFLFLRFFCPAVLNPKLFGLLKDHPGVRAQRTLTLVAKSLQGLANMSSFGVKEPWMSPMNEFLSEHLAEFKDFVHSVITIAPHQNMNPPPPPAYVTPTTILARLPPAQKEGFPSLPYLIDEKRCYAALVNMWLSRYSSFPPKHQTLCREVDSLRNFHAVCVEIKERIGVCVKRAEDRKKKDDDRVFAASFEEEMELEKRKKGFSFGLRRKKKEES